MLLQPFAMAISAPEPRFVQLLALSVRSLGHPAEMCSMALSVSAMHSVSVSSSRLAIAAIDRAPSSVTREHLARFIALSRLHSRAITPMVWSVMPLHPERSHSVIVLNWPRMTPPLSVNMLFGRRRTSRRPSCRRASPRTRSSSSSMSHPRSSKWRIEWLAMPLHIARHSAESRSVWASRTFWTDLLQRRRAKSQATSCFTICLNWMASRSLARSRTTGSVCVERSSANDVPSGRLAQASAISSTCSSFILSPLRSRMRRGERDRITEEMHLLS
mmetsp:Transcript_4651/g.10944  ORF Transcript_4651/g.10944 Transcript_4651/m.10944 type:complete len:274 (+) Transcript_4651:775-1596(+)